MVPTFSRSVFPVSNTYSPGIVVPGRMKHEKCLKPFSSHSAIRCCLPCSEPVSVSPSLDPTKSCLPIVHHIIIHIYIYIYIHAVHSIHDMYQKVFTCLPFAVTSFTSPSVGWLHVRAGTMRRGKAQLALQIRPEGRVLGKTCFPNWWIMGK